MDPLEQRAASGDLEAMGEIVRRHYGDVYRFLLNRMPLLDAEDATQETFLIAGKRLRTFRWDSTMKTWLFGIAINVARNRSRKRENPLPNVSDVECPDPTDGLIAAGVLKDALSKLSSEHREVVLLHEMDGLNYEECAQVLGVPAGTVKSRLHHAFRRLRELIEPGVTAT